jgi:hypothetical protein
MFHQTFFKRPTKVCKRLKLNPFVCILGVNNNKKKVCERLMLDSFEYILGVNKKKKKKKRFAKFARNVIGSQVWLESVPPFLNQYLDYDVHFQFR